MRNCELWNTKQTNDSTTSPGSVSAELMVVASRLRHFFSVFYALAIQHGSFYSRNETLLKQRVSRMNDLIYDILERWSNFFLIFKKSINLSQTNRGSRIESISFLRILVLILFDKLKIDCHAYEIQFIKYFVIVFCIEIKDFINTWTLYLLLFVKLIVKYFHFKSHCIHSLVLL